MATAMPKTSSLLYCSKCGKTLDSKNFYTYKDGTHPDLCKACQTLHINNFEPDTFKWLLQEFDVPYVEAEWNVLRDRAYTKDPYKINGMSVFGKYLSKMKLRQWKDYTWADTERLAEEAAAKAAETGNTPEQLTKKIEDMKQRYENGEITEAQYLTYAAINAPAPVYDGGEPPTAKGKGQGAPSPYPMNASPFEEVEIEDVGASLTKDDKIYLALKWGQLYSSADWVALEKLYDDFQASFDIQGAARIDQLKHICKISLKANQALDSGDIENYQRLMRVYDAQMKAAKFTEAQNKEEKGKEFDSIGAIVAFCEKETGFIPSHYCIDDPIKTPKDKVDIEIRDQKDYLKELIESDPTISKKVEDYIEKRRIAEEMRQAQLEAVAAGQSNVVLSDDDLSTYSTFVDEQQKEDKEVDRDTSIFTMRERKLSKESEDDEE